MKYTDNRVFLSRTDSIRTDEPSIDIILSPEYYWVKKVHLPVSKIREARRLLPSVFDEILPPDDTYHYLISPTEAQNIFVAVAFSKKTVLDSVQKQIEPCTSVHKIYFAQFVLATEVEECLQIDRKRALVKIGGLLLSAPSRCENGKSVQDILPHIRLSRHAITFSELTARTVPQRASLLLFAALLFLTTLFAVEGGYFAYLDRSLNNDIENAKNAYHIPTTSFQLESILSHLQKTDHRQRSIRAFLKLINDIPLQGSTKLAAVVVNRDACEVVFHLSDQKDRRQILSYFSRKNRHIESSYKNSKLKVVISYG